MLLLIDDTYYYIINSLKQILSYKLIGSTDLIQSLFKNIKLVKSHRKMGKLGRTPYSTTNIFIISRHMI